MERALSLAHDAAAFASPNPAVGCVLLRAGVVLGEGAHRYDARDHAEIAALKHAAAQGHAVRGATAYVTLEPCSHYGRTGPCADALLAAGIARCVVATGDPNPLVRGGGFAKLRAGGVQVDVLDPASGLAQAARRLTDAFAFAIQFGRPLVTRKAAVSSDGMLAPAVRSAERAPHWLTGEAARADVHQLRHANDAVLTGIGTVLADDPALTDRTDVPRRRPLLRVVLDARLRMPLDARLVQGAANDVLVLCGEDADTGREQALRARGVEVLRLAAPHGRVDLREVLGTLQQRGIRSVLAEGGSTLNGALLEADLADKIVLYFAPSELGRDAVPFAAGDAPPRALQQRLSAMQTAAFAHGTGEDLRVSGYLHDPWADIAT